jgi:hypothetical protein
MSDSTSSWRLHLCSIVLRAAEAVAREIATIRTPSSRRSRCTAGGLAVYVISGDLPGHAPSARADSLYGRRDLRPVDGTQPPFQMSQSSARARHRGSADTTQMPADRFESLNDDRTEAETGYLSWAKLVRTCSAVDLVKGLADIVGDGVGGGNGVRPRLGSGPCRSGDLSGRILTPSLPFADTAPA